jgi:hypothetical protein
MSLLFWYGPRVRVGGKTVLSKKATSTREGAEGTRKETKEAGKKGLEKASSSSFHNLLLSLLLILIF